MDKLKIIKVSVFIMTLLLVVGMMALVAGLLNGKDKKTAPTLPQTYPVAIEEEVPDSVKEIWLGEYEGSEIKDFKSCGRNLCLLIADGGEDDRIVVVNRQGKVIQKLHVGEKADNDNEEKSASESDSADKDMKD